MCKRNLRFESKHNRRSFHTDSTLRVDTKTLSNANLEQCFYLDIACQIWMRMLTLLILDMAATGIDDGRVSSEHRVDQTDPCGSGDNEQGLAILPCCS